jgi:hypothetical protein
MVDRQQELAAALHDQLPLHWVGRSVSGMHIPLLGHRHLAEKIAAAEEAE